MYLSSNCSGILQTKGLLIIIYKNSSKVTGWKPFHDPQKFLLIQLRCIIIILITHTLYVH